MSNQEQADKLIKEHTEWLNDTKAHQSEDPGVSPVEFPTDAFCGVKSRGVDFSFANMSHVSFRRSDLIKSTFYKTNLSYANFDKARLERARFRECNLKNANFVGANCRYAVFYDSDLFNTNFQRADAKGVKFQWSNLRCAIFQYANLADAEFEQLTDVSGATLYSANLIGATLDSGLVHFADLRLANIARTTYADVHASCSGLAYCRLDFGGWSVCVNTTETTIGRVTRQNIDWLQSTPESWEIVSMSEHAASWWRVHGEAIKAVIRCVMKKSVSLGVYVKHIKNPKPDLIEDVEE